jgi:sulfite exporter TauE/SafE
MQTSLILTAFVMGLAGGPHCVAMCGAACGGIAQNNGKTAAIQFQTGRLMGYAILGALAALSVGMLAWLTNQTNILHPVWTFFHVLVLVWGLVLLVYARQPIWIDSFGRKIWQYLRRITQLRGGVVLTGMLWALMPCGLLYSAVLVASLSGSPLQGAVSMACFAAGSSLSLLLAPWLWLRLKTNGLLLSEPYSMRIAGLILLIVSGWAIWMDIVHQTKIFCLV